MAAIRTPDDGRPPQQDREEAARTWLGAAKGGERLARIFQVGRTARAAELEAELAELRAKLDTLEDELWALRQQPGGSDAHPAEVSDAPLVNLPRVLLPRERDYRLARCEGFAVFAGARPLGAVEGVRYHSRTDRPDLLEVRSGRFSQRLLLIPVTDIEAIEPDDEAVIVKEGLGPPQPREDVRAYLERLFRRRAGH
jgi:hypothetical protein